MSRNCILYRENMTADQIWCLDLLCDVFGGEHHLGHVYECGSGIKVSMPGDRLATFDLDYLTRLVVLAHDRCVRVEVAPGGPYRVKLLVHKRYLRKAGRVNERHPEIEDAIREVRRA